MLALMQILRCGSGRQKEALMRLRWIHGLMTEREDSGGCIVAKHLGNPIDLLILRFWVTPEAMMRRTNSYYQDRWPLFPPNEPEGIYQTQDIAHYWDEVTRVDGDASGAFLWRITQRVARERWNEFLDLRRSEAELLRQCGGLVSARTFRGLNDDEMALTILRLRDRGCLDAAVALTGMATIETRLREITSPLDYPILHVFHSECFEVVDEQERALPAGSETRR
jgi:hypothetical protein